MQLFYAIKTNIVIRQSMTVDFMTHLIHFHLNVYILTLSCILMLYFMRFYFNMRQIYN